MLCDSFFGQEALAVDALFSSIVAMVLPNGLAAAVWYWAEMAPWEFTLT